MIQTVNVNVAAQPTSGGPESFLVLSQNENGRQIRFRILGDDLPAGCTATFSGTKPDGNVYSASGTIDGNFVLLDEEIQMTAVAGRWDAKLSIAKGTENIMTSLIRVTVVADAVAGDSIPSDSELDGIVAECRSYAEAAKNEAYGSPLTAATAAAMTDQSRVYVYTGSESGMTAGHWYYYNGTAWTDGGVYNAVAVDTDTTLSIAGKAADAKEVGDQLADVKEELSDNFYINGNVKPTLTSGQYINATNNAIASTSGFSMTAPVPVKKGQKVTLTARGYNTVTGMINLYDSETDTYETVVASTDSSEHTYTYTATKECDVRFSYAKNYPASATIITSATSSVRLDKNESDVADLQNSISAPVEYPQMFTNVICIGDSLTYGHDGQTRLETNYPFYFGKLADATISNQGLSGRTTKQWWDELGNSFDHFADYECAIIYLGTNGGLTDTVSTDCNASDYTQNADTNTGCYGKIIGKIKADAPDCKIFCVAGPNEYVVRTDRNNVIRQIAALYDVGLIDIEECILSDNGETSTVQRYTYRPYDGIHYNKLGYFTFANMIYDYMKNYMKNHLSKYVS